MLTIISTPALLALEDGSLFWGKSIGVSGQTTGEVVFNTSMTGYQEILTDPSYAHQIITLTCPQIGNVGINAEDMESSKIWATGLVIKNLSLSVSNWRAQQTLSSFLKENGIVAIADIDTRQLTRLLRNKGALNGCIMAGEIDPQIALKTAQSFSGLKNRDLAKEVSTQVPYTWHEGSWQLKNLNPYTPKDSGFRVVAYDFGIKRNILRRLVDAGCHITVVPAQTSAEEALRFKPDGIFLSNGPGDPAPCDYAISAIQHFLKKDIPLFGICLGHQLLGLACHAKTIKMKFGHHGANHPVQELATGQVLMSSQNHGFAIEESSLPSVLIPTHRSLFDGSLQGIRHTEKRAFSFQGHPEASPGPHEATKFFDQFVDLMS